MSVIHVTQQIESDTLHLPELRPLIGKKVEITIRELQTPGDSESGWDALAALAGQDLLDPEAFKELRNLEHDPWNDDARH
jgi:hypothetical protein